MSSGATTSAWRTKEGRGGLGGYGSGLVVVETVKIKKILIFVLIFWANFRVNFIPTITHQDSTARDAPV